MSATYESHLSCCPFYHRENGYMIQCDGWVPRQTLSITFETKKDAAAHKNSYCRCVDGEAYSGCPVYRFLSEML